MLDTTATAHSSSLPFPRFPQVQLAATLDGKLGMVGSPLSIQFSPSWQSRCQEDRPAGRFVFSRPPRKKDDGSRSRERRERKERKKGTMRVSCARTSDPTFLSYLWHKIAGNCVSVCQDDFSSRPLGPTLRFKTLHCRVNACRAFPR